MAVVMQVSDPSIGSESHPSRKLPGWGVAAEKRGRRRS